MVGGKNELKNKFVCARSDWPSVTGVLKKLHLIQYMYIQSELPRPIPRNSVESDHG